MKTQDILDALSFSDIKMKTFPITSIQEAKKDVRECPEVFIEDVLTEIKSMALRYMVWVRNAVVTQFN